MTSRTAVPERAEASWPPAVVAGASQTGVLAVRSLQRRGVHALCFDANPQLPGFRSIWGPARLCPHPDAQRQEWLRFMIDLAASLPAKPALIASSDQYVTAVADHVDELAAHFILSPGCRLQGLLADKESQYALAATHGLPMPATAYVQSEAEVAAFAATAAYPCLLKPTHFRVWQRFPAGHPLAHQKIAIAADAAALLSLYRLASALTPRAIVQEIIQGPDTNKRVYLACYSADGRKIAAAMFRELRCDPLGFGPASVSEPIVDATTERICDDFLRRIGYVGINEFEMKWDDRDGQVKLIEANPRLSGGGDAAPYAGVDLPWLHYLDLIGQRVEPVAPSGRDFRHVVVRADGKALPAYWKAGLLDLGGAWRSLRPPLAFYDLDSRDWAYSVETLLIAGRSFLREAFSGGQS